jgi:flagellar protein FliO/FliZ
MRSTSIVLSGLLFSVPAISAEAGSFDAASSIGALLFVLVLIIGLGWGLKRMKIPTLNGHKDFQVIRQLPLGTKERLLVVQVGDEQYLIGSTAQNINLISKLDEPLTTSSSAASSPFAKQFRQLVSQHEKK